jgi:hypothetical protein
MADDIKNFAIVDVFGTGHSVSETAVRVYQSTKLPTAPFNAVWWNFTDHQDYNDDPNVEIVRVTAVDTATDILTVVRAQESTTASAKNVGGRYRLAAVPTAHTFETDVPGGVPVKASGAEITTGTNDTKFATPKAISDAGIVATPVKASGTEVDTGTDDAKFVTAKAIADSGLASETYVNTEDAQRIGNDAQYTKVTTGAQTLLGGNPVARAIIIHVEVDETFAAGDGAATSFDIGETGSLTKFKSGLTAGTAGDKLTYAGYLSANTALVITATAATGTGTGGIHVTALALPEA